MLCCGFVVLYVILCCVMVLRSVVGVVLYCTVLYCALLYRVVSCVAHCIVLCIVTLRSALS